MERNLFIGLHPALRANRPLQERAAANSIIQGGLGRVGGRRRIAAFKHLLSYGSRTTTATTRSKAYRECLRGLPARVRDVGSSCCHAIRYVSSGGSAGG